MEPFLVRAVAGGIGVALIAAPLGCFVVWQRMAYFGETVAQASLIGIAMGLMLHLDLTGSALIMSALMALLLVLLARQTVVPMDSLLGLLAHTALAIGVIGMSLAQGPSIDLMGYLFGDIFAVSATDLLWVLGGGLVVIAALIGLWSPLLKVAVHEELAAAEGVHHTVIKTAFVLLLALAIAIAIKIVGVLLAIAFLIMPAAAARPLSATPEQMAILAAGLSVAGVLAGLSLSMTFDVPGGPAIVVVLALASAGSLLATIVRRQTR